MSASRFFQFLGVHSFLIGLLPFFIPVYLWRAGFELAHLSLFIGISGLSFCAVLSLWQHAARRWPLPRLIATTFVIEISLIGTLALLGNSLFGLAALAVVNGLYNAFFWTTQRTLFLGITTASNTGRQYGNFQIFVTVFLKVGLLVGGVLLDAGGIFWLLLLSAITGLASSFWFYHDQATTEPLDQFDGTNVSASLGFNDGQRSRQVFIIDGLFLYLESHFWTLSLFLLVNEDYSRLGVTIVVLALVFSAIFYAIKNTIDQYDGKSIYAVAVVLYAASWLMRGGVSPETPLHWILPILIIITFCSSFFRLAFNKRFFDLAKHHNGTQYLLTKSYVSQLVLGISYVLLAITMFAWPEIITMSGVYIAAAILALAYMGYGTKVSA